MNLTHLELQVCRGSAQEKCLCTKLLVIGKQKSQNVQCGAETHSMEWLKLCVHML